MAAQPQPGQRRWTQGLDRSKAAKLYIDNYYSNLLKRRQEREDRYVGRSDFVLRVSVWRLAKNFAC